MSEALKKKVGKGVFLLQKEPECEEAERRSFL